MLERAISKRAEAKRAISSGPMGKAPLPELDDGGGVNKRCMKLKAAPAPPSECGASPSIPAKRRRSSGAKGVQRRQSLSASQQNLSIPAKAQLATAQVPGPAGEGSASFCEGAASPSKRRRSMSAKAVPAPPSEGSASSCEGTASTAKHRRSTSAKVPPSPTKEQGQLRGGASPSPTKQRGHLRGGSPASPAKEKSPAKGTSPPDAIQGRLLGDGIVALALADILGLPGTTVRSHMRRWEKPILKVPIPGAGGRVPSQAMLATAKAAVMRFFEGEEALGARSHVSKAFHLASRESHLTFAWDRAKQRVQRAKLDSLGLIDSWKDCLAMVSGDSNTTSEIYVCGTRKVTLAALTSLICHEGLHNLARRTRRGNPFLGEDTEHIAMAMFGDPQLAA